MACFVILQYDLWTASYGIPERTLLASPLGAWIGYPGGGGGAMLYGYSTSPAWATRKAFFLPGLSVVKDVLYARTPGPRSLRCGPRTPSLVSRFSAPVAHPYVGGRRHALENGNGMGVGRIQ